MGKLFRKTLRNRKFYDCFIELTALKFQKAQTTFIKNLSCKSFRNLVKVQEKQKSLEKFKKLRKVLKSL